MICSKLGAIILLCATILSLVDSSCLGNNGGQAHFVGSPKLYQTDYKHVHISWGHTVRNEECVTSYKVNKYDCRDNFLERVGKFMPGKTHATASVKADGCYKFQVTLYSEGHLKEKSKRVTIKTEGHVCPNCIP